jgi:hypothetical protein
MDPMVLGLLVRFFERITVVIIGGMAVYLGFRLFREVPRQRNSSGKVVFPWDFSIVLTRVGPGVFFALFGVVAASLALIRPLEILPGQHENKGGDGKLSYSTETPSSRDNRADGRKLLQKNFAALNYISSSLRPDIPEQDRNSINGNIAEIKLKLMKPVWGNPDEGFGEFERFENWVKNGESDPPPEGMKGALDLYRYKH